VLAAERTVAAVRLAKKKFLRVLKVFISALHPWKSCPSVD